jgi:hypothetical protein
MFRRIFLISVVALAALQFLSAAHAKKKDGGGTAGRPAPRPRRFGFLVGTVTDAATGSPIRGAVVRARSAARIPEPLPLDGASATQDRIAYPYPADYTTTTNGRGKYFLQVPLGNYAVAASARGFEDKSSKDLLTVQARKNTRFDFALAARGVGKVTGTVLGVAPDGTKKPLACANVNVYPNDFVYIQASNSARPDIYPYPFHVRTDAAGKFTIENVPSGEVSISAYRLGYGYASDNVTLQNGQTADVTLELPLQSATVTGTVTDSETGQKLAGVLVTVKVLYDERPEVLVGAAALKQAAQDDCPPPEVELIGVTDENGQYELLLPIYDVIAYEDNARGGVMILPPFPQRQVLVAFKRGYGVGTQNFESPQIGTTMMVDFQLTKAQ